MRWSNGSASFLCLPRQRNKDVNCRQTERNQERRKANLLLLSCTDSLSFYSPTGEPLHSALNTQNEHNKKTEDTFQHAKARRVNRASTNHFRTTKAHNNPKSRRVASSLLLTAFSC